MKLVLIIVIAALLFAVSMVPSTESKGVEKLKVQVNTQPFGEVSTFNPQQTMSGELIQPAGKVK